jgi:hypothetical protein
MKNNVRKAFTALKEIDAPVFVRDNYLMISAEDNDNEIWADYYGEFRGGYPWVNPKVEQILSDNGLYAEWEDPGTIYVGEK